MGKIPPQYFASLLKARPAHCALACRFMLGNISHDTGKSRELSTHISDTLLTHWHLYALRYFLSVSLKAITASARRTDAPCFSRCKNTPTSLLRFYIFKIFEPPWADAITYMIFIALFSSTIAWCRPIAASPLISLFRRKYHRRRHHRWYDVARRRQLATIEGRFIACRCFKNNKYITHTRHTIGDSRDFLSIFQFSAAQQGGNEMYISILHQNAIIIIEAHISHTAATTMMRLVN